MTVSMCFLMGVLKLKWPDCMNGMMYYSFLLIGEMRFTGENRVCKAA